MLQKLLLVAEDFEPIREALVQVLALAGFSVFVATNGEEAVEQTQRHLPDLVMMDLRMPSLDGWEATRRIKGHPETAHIPIVAISAEPNLTRDRLEQAGFIAHLRKPFLGQHVVDAVRQCLHGAARGATWIDLPTPTMGTAN